MKKLLVLVAAACVALTLTACGGSAGSDKTDCGFFSVTIPEGYEGNEYMNEFVNTADENEKIKIQVDENTFGTAADEAEERLSMSGEYTKLDDVTIGDYTWYVVGFNWNGGNQSALYYTDVNDCHVTVSMFGFTADDPVGQQFMETIEFVPDQNLWEVDQAWMKAINEKA